jgi:hypothetical protein
MPQMDGVITIVQEGRFQLTDLAGIAHHFILSRHALAETEQLPRLAREQARVRVKYAQAPGLIAFEAKRIELLGDRA